MKKTAFSLFIILAYLVAGCQNTAPAAVPSLPPAGIKPDPTVTPTPLQLPQAPTPTSIVSDLVATETYTHTTGRFQIEYPANWQSIERADGVIFIEPGGQAGYSVFFSDVGETYSPEQLNQFLLTFVAQNFVDVGEELGAINQKTLPDGSITAQFTTKDSQLGQTVNQVDLHQKDTFVFIMLMSAEAEQWEISQERLQALTNTLTPLDTTPAAEMEPTDELPVWVLAGPDSNQFAFFSPSDWEVVIQEQNRVAVKMPETDVVFEASSFAWPGAGSDPEAPQKAAEAFVTSLEKKYDEVQHLPAVEFPLFTMDGATIDFLYTTAEGESRAGSVITGGEQGQMYRVVFFAPAEYYQAALEWFNPMYKSFKTLSPEELTVDPNAGP